MKQEPEFLGPVDTAFLHVESDVAPMNIGAVSLFEGRITFEAFIKHVDDRIHQAPTYLKRLVIPPFNVGQPRWMDDPMFDVRSHVFKARVDAPGGEEQIRRLAGKLISSRLDRNKPLWEIYYLDGLTDDRTALLFKVHHAMVDGIAAIELFTVLLDLTPTARYTSDKPFVPPEPLPEPTQLLVDSLMQEVSYKVEILGKLSQNLSFLGSVLGDSEKRRRMFLGAANLLNDVLTPLQPLAITGRNTGDQEVAWTDFSLQEVKAIRAATGVSVNDVMLAVLAGAVDRYEALQHGLAGRKKRIMRVLVPVNMRDRDDHEQHNRISVLPIDVPLGEDDPVRRLRTIGEYTRTMKASYLANELDTVLSLPSLSPAITQPLIWSLAPSIFAAVAHTWCTNVAGPDLPVYLMGHPMLRSYGFFPLNPSMGLACVIMSYDGRISMNLIADKGIVDDVRTIREYAHESFRALREAAGVRPVEVVVIQETRVVIEELVKVPTAPVLSETPPEPPLAPPNGSHTAQEAVFDAHPEAVVETVVEDNTQDDAEQGYPLFSQAWADAFRTAINQNPNYKRTSTHWRAGALAFLLRASAGKPSAAVLLDLHQGDCRDARSLPLYEATNRAAFAIEGDHHAWMRVLHGEVAPLAALMRGDLRLAKGSLLRLLPFTQSAEQLVMSAQHVPLEG